MTGLHDNCPRCPSCGKHRHAGDCAPIGYVVFCHICGKSYHEQDPEVRWIQTDGVWECFDEGACFERAALERML